MNPDPKYTQTTEKHAVRNQLKEGVVNLCFQKTGGTVRNMRGTLLQNCLPDYPADNIAPPPQDHLQLVWDLDAKAWRSFLWERLISAEKGTFES